jgi:chromosome segregation ATPase
MTTEDLNQIRAVLREEIGASETRLREEFRQEIRAAETRLREEIAAAERRMIERQDRAVEALTINLTELRTELTNRIAGLGKRIDLLEERVNGLSNLLFSLESRMVGFGRTLDTLLKETSANNGTIEGYRRAFDALEARVKAIEEKLGGQGAPPQ